MPSARTTALATLAIVTAAIAVATAAGAFSRADGTAGPSRVRTAAIYEQIRGDLRQEAYDLEFLLIHVRLDTPAELGAELSRLARGSRAQADALAGAGPPATIAGLVATLRGQLAAQARTLARLAGAARTAGPDPVRAARPALRAQAERVLDARRRLETAFLIGS